jgi:ABC-type uncharacterized transport system ATPase subunit
MKSAKHPPRVEAFNLGKRFGSLVALDQVNLKLEPATFHVLLGENGAGKSTLVKCLMGYQQPDAGSVLIGDVEVDLHSPRDAHHLGLGMVYQHFTVVPNLSVAENLVLAKDHLPWLTASRPLRAELEAFMATAPFKLPLDGPVSGLAAGQKQKLEILKQLYVGRQVLILDEPTSVLTPQEADEVLGLIRAMVQAGGLSVLMITHKFREVEAYADAVTVLRRGRLAGSGKTADLNRSALSAMMMGEDAPTAAAVPEVRSAAPANTAEPVLELRKLGVDGDAGVRAVSDVDLVVRPGEIVGIAGVSGNGQRELLEAIAGQRPVAAGGILVQGKPLPAAGPVRRRLPIRCLPEEPLRNACCGAMSVAENLALHVFDRPERTRLGWFIRFGGLMERAKDLIARYGVRPPVPTLPIAGLSGGNVQRAVLARSLEDQPAVLVVANPCFGLDVRAVAEIHGRLRAARERGAGVLLISEDLDEILELSDRLIVICGGLVTHATTPAETSPHALGPYLAGSAA